MKQIDMTHGSIAKKLLSFAVPIAITGILQQMFNAADVAVVGRFATSDAMAAVGSNSSCINLMVTLFLGLSLGANIVISRRIGQKDEEGTKRGIQTALLTAFFGGLLLAAVGELLAGPLIHWMGVPDKVAGMALLYLRIYMAGMPVILLYNFETAIFRAQGDSRTPLICLIVSGVLNVGLNLFFVIVCHMDVDGVAIATVISNAVSSALMYVLLRRSKFSEVVRVRNLHMDPVILRHMMSIGIPAGLQSMVFALSNVIIQSAINSLGTKVMAASSAAVTIETMVYLVLNGFGQACTTFIGQNYGAGLTSRCHRITRISFLQCIGAAAVTSVLVIVFAKQLLLLFSADPEVIAYGVSRVRIVVSFEVVNGLMEIFSGTMRGYGHSLFPSVCALVGVCGSRFFWIYAIFPKHHTFAWLIYTYPVSWIVTAAAMAIAYFILMKKMHRLPAPPARQPQ